MRRFLPYFGDTAARQAWDELFSREMLGAVLVGSALGKIVEKALNLALDSTAALLGGWAGTFALAVAVFVWWHRLAEAVED